MFLSFCFNFYIVILTIKINRDKRTLNDDCSDVLYSYALLGRLKSAGVTEIATFEGTLHRACIKILLSLCQPVP